MFVESSSPAATGQKARLCSKVFKGPAKKRLTFKYHSFVHSSTIFRVLVKNSTGEEIVLKTFFGRERTEWLSDSVTIRNNVDFQVNQAWFTILRSML